MTVRLLSPAVVALVVSLPMAVGAGKPDGRAARSAPSPQLLHSLSVQVIEAPPQSQTARDTGQVAMPHAPGLLIHRQPAPDFQPTPVYRWVDLLLEVSGRDSDRNSPRPPILSRTMSIVITAMYDAWAAYDAKAVGTRLHDKLRRPPAERTRDNQERALAYAAFRALLFVHPQETELLRAEFRRRGFDPDNASTDVNTLAGVGNSAAGALIEYRRHDGANQLGDLPGGDGTPYADYTGYRPRNSAGHFADKTAWCPIPFSDGKGGTVSPGFLHPQCFKVKPFALERVEMFRPPPPPRFGSEQLKREVDEVIWINGHLRIEHKAVVEFMREGPHSTGQSGHWLQFAQDVSRRDHNDLDQDMRLFFSVANVVFDAFMACWEAKRFYDTGRPYWWVRLDYPGQLIDGWLGPGKGSGRVEAEGWVPYSPATFVTPPFPGYVSGHASASGAGSRMLELVTGSDRYGAMAFQEAGYMTEPGFTAAQMQARAGKPATGLSASRVVRIALPTFTATAEMAALSRLWGGYHIRTDNDEGLILGRRVASYSWPRYRAYFEGTAPPPGP